MRTQIKVNMGSSYKLGMNEVVGLKEAMAAVFQPVVEHLDSLQTWGSSGDWFQPSEVEYTSRDGFIAHKHNCGGLMINQTVPKCGECDFGFLEFGEYVPSSDALSEEEQDAERDSEEGDGLLDAHLRIWFKFEGINEDGELEFYINACGGNSDAPYFRPQYLADFFEASFTCKSVAGLKRAASKHVKALIKVLK